MATLDLDGFSDQVGNVTFGGTGGLSTSVNSLLTGAGTVTLGGTVTTSATGNPTTPALISGNVALAAGTRTFNVADSLGSVVDLNVNARSPAQVPSPSRALVSWICRVQRLILTVV